MIETICGQCIETLHRNEIIMKIDILLRFYLGGLRPPFLCDHMYLAARMVVIYKFSCNHLSIPYAQVGRRGRKTQQLIDYMQ